jgi:hypothetical protein
VVPQHRFKPTQHLEEPRVRGVEAFKGLHRLLELLVLLDVVLDRGLSVGQVLAHGRVDVHLLGDGVTHQFGDDRVGHVAATLGGRGGDLLDQFTHLTVIGGEDVDDILLPGGRGHDCSCRR